MSSTTKQEFLKAAHAHVAEHGQKNWKVLFEKFPDVSDQSKWRWLRDVRKDAPPPSLIENARDKLVASVKKFPTTDRAKSIPDERLDPSAADVVNHLPAAPSPSYIAKNGDEGLRTIDFVAEIQSLYRDASMLRAYAMKLKPGENGEMVEHINNPAAFDKSIVRRAGLLETAIRAVQEVWDLRTMQNFYETIIDEIGKESPECQRRIMERLALLNQRTGMTLGAMRV